MYVCVRDDDADTTIGGGEEYGLPENITICQGIKVYDSSPVSSISNTITAPVFD